MTMESRQSYVERTHEAMRDEELSPVGLLADELAKRRVEASERAHDLERQARDWRAIEHACTAALDAIQETKAVE